MNYQLSQLVDIRAGHPFRGSIEEVPGSDEYVVQLRDVDAVEGVSWSTVTPTSVLGRGMPYWIEQGDILFMARGSRNFAVYIEDVPYPAVCSPHFFHMRVKSGQIDPAFLSWQINQAPAQLYFQRSREGTSQPSIRREVLEQLRVANPSYKVQRGIIGFAQKIKEEARLLAALQQKNQSLMNAIANDVHKGKIQ